MFLTKLIVTFGLITISYQQSVDSIPNDLVVDLMKIAQKMANDQADIFQLTERLNGLSKGNQMNVQQLPANQRANQLMGNQIILSAPESNQIGANPLVTLQSRINAFFESMNQLFDNIRHIFERSPIVLEDTDLDPLKALQTLEKQFQDMLAGLRVDKTVNGTTNTQ